MSWSDLAGGMAPAIIIERFDARSWPLSLQFSRGEPKAATILISLQTARDARLPSEPTNSPLSEREVVGEFVE